MNFLVLIPILFVIYLIIIDFVPLSPFNDVARHTFNDRIMEFINYFIFSSVGLYSWFELPGYVWVSLVVTTLLIGGYVFAWWIPYFKGHYSDYTRQEYEYSFSKTLKILPPIKDHPIPDLEHMFVGLFIIAWFVAVVLKNYRISMNFLVLIPALSIVYTSILCLIDLYPLNDIEKFTPAELKATLAGSCFYAGIVAYTWLALPGYLGINLFFSFLGLVVYAINFWIPYFWGHYSELTKETYERFGSETIKILPPIKDHPIPDLAAMISGLFIIAWFVAAVLKFIG